MTTMLEHELEQMRVLIFKMADLVIEAVENSVDALKNSDSELAEKVIDADSLLDQLEMRIDDECIRLLVTKQPAATDLRMVLAMLKINTDLERMGDLAGNIAREAIRLDGKPTLKPLVDIPRMSDLCVEMIKLSFRSIAEKNSDTARKAILIDEKIDELNIQIYRELLSYLAESPNLITPSLGLIMAAKALERIGDHAKNIAERAVYYIEGVDIRHGNM
jgi:phosphate transport system protein